MNYFGSNKISKEEFLKINEDDVMFISNPGRMGDVSGYNIVVKNNNKLILYRIECLMKKNEYNNILNEDVINQFPIWYKELKNNNENYRKYHYLYMGFGNGLSIDNSIYNEFEPYLNDLVTALNSIGVAPIDLISILQALKKSGSLQADLIII